MKRLAAEAKAQQAEAKKQADAKKQAEARPKHARSPQADPSSTAPARNSTLTRDERRELDAMANARDDEFFFRRLMGGVVPLENDGRGRIQRSEAPSGDVASSARVERLSAERQERSDDLVRDHLMQLVEGAVRFEVLDDGRHLEGRRLDLDMGTFRRLRRGELPVDGQLDLHGATAASAKDTLYDFLKARRARKDRVVLVIHGRGEHSPGGMGVLRGEIAAWLSQDRASQHVAAFATAHQQEGGEGALYVLLRP